jgi:membrane-bound metal-dependent hydrolase YbcI (DUF457 family)
MANFRAHAIAGAVAGFGITIYQLRKIKEIDPDAKLDIFKLFVNVGAGITGAILPDKIEPALHPNHRAFFHSMTSGGCLVYSAKEMISDPSSIDPDLKYPLCAFILGYCSHLILDGATPKGLPLLY